MADAVLLGSLTSRGGGARLVLIEQKRQPRVHVSPINMMVAVANIYIIVIILVNGTKE